MTVHKVIVATLVSLFAGVCCAHAGEKQSPGQEKGNSETKKVSAENFRDVFKLVKPAAKDWSWLEIPWMIDFGEARKRAFEEGKPLFVWIGSGSSPIGCT